jgi:hypothetical protein
MQLTDYTFTEGTSLEAQGEIRTCIENADSLEDIFEDWFIRKGGRFGLGVALQDDGTLDCDTILLSLDAPDGAELCTIDIPRGEISRMYPSAISLDSFVKGWRKQPLHLELHDKKYKAWMRELGFTESYALMSVIGPRRAVIPLMLCFALSKGGVIEARHIRRDDYPDEDYGKDLAEEGIDLDEYFSLYGMYVKDPVGGLSYRSMFDPFYCRKVA